MQSVTRRVGLVVAALGLMAATGGRAGAGQVLTFDFEDRAPTASNDSFPGALTSLGLTQSGLTLTITRQNGVRFDLNDNPTIPGISPDFGSRSLAPFFAQTSPTAFLGDFSHAVDAVSIVMGDFSQDADTLELQAFSGLGGTGTLLSVVTGSLPASSPTTFTSAILSITAAGIRSIVFRGGSANFQNSVYYDNIQVRIAPVPEPSTLISGGMAGIAGLGLAWRNRRRKAA